MSMDQFTSISVPSTWSKGKKNLSSFDLVWFDLLMQIVPVSYWYLNTCYKFQKKKKNQWGLHIKKIFWAWRLILLKSIPFLNSPADLKKKSEEDAAHAPKTH